MNSIEEFATEYAQDKYLPVQTFQAVKAGANYVISCIEKEMLSCKEFSQSQLRLIMQFCEKLEAINKQ